MSGLILKASVDGAKPREARLVANHEVGSGYFSCDSLTGWAPKASFTVYEIDDDGNPVDGSDTDWIANVNNSTLEDVEITSGVDRPYQANKTIVVADYTAGAHNRLADALLETLNADGTLATGVVSGNALSNNSVSNDKIANGAVTEGKIADGSISAGKIKDNAINNNKVADNSLNGAKILNNTIQLSKLKDATVADQNGWKVTRLLNGKKRYFKTGSFGDNTRLNKFGFTYKTFNPNKPANTHVVSITVSSADQAVSVCPCYQNSEFAVAIHSLYDNASTNFRWLVEVEDN